MHFVIKSPSCLFENHKHLTKVLRVLVGGFFSWDFIIIGRSGFSSGFLGCFVSVSYQCFILICSNIHFIKCCFIKDILWKHICGKMYHVIVRVHALGRPAHPKVSTHPPLSGRKEIRRIALWIQKSKIWKKSTVCDSPAEKISRLWPKLSLWLPSLGQDGVISSFENMLFKF